SWFCQVDRVLFRAIFANKETALSRFCFSKQGLDEQQLQKNATGFPVRNYYESNCFSARFLQTKKRL
ncbi:MAG: hypothetical protein ACLFR1_11605, partial [Spirochaetia bacterium]